MKKTVLISGACINTGVAIVEKFASNGYNVIFTGRDKERVDTISATIRLQYFMDQNRF